MRPLNCLIACCGLALTASNAGAVQLEYEFLGQLDDGGTVQGTFAFDTDTFIGAREFEASSHNLTVTNSSVFATSGNGSSTSLTLYQSELPGLRQDLSILFIGDSVGDGGAFTQILFESAPADPFTFQPLLSENFTTGYLDGNGMAYFTSVSITQVPEPAGLALLALAPLALVRRRYRQG